MFILLLYGVYDVYDLNLLIIIICRLVSPFCLIPFYIHLGGCNVIRKFKLCMARNWYVLSTVNRHYHKALFITAFRENTKFPTVKILI